MKDRNKTGLCLLAVFFGEKLPVRYKPTAGYFSGRMTAFGFPDRTAFPVFVLPEYPVYLRE